MGQVKSSTSPGSSAEQRQVNTARSRWRELFTAGAPALQLRDRPPAMPGQVQSRLRQGTTARHAAHGGTAYANAHRQLHATVYGERSALAHSC